MIYLCGRSSSLVYGPYCVEFLALGVVVVFWNHYKFVKINKSGSFCIWLHLDLDDKLS